MRVFRCCLFFFILLIVYGSPSEQSCKEISVDVSNVNNESTYAIDVFSRIVRRRSNSTVCRSNTDNTDCRYNNTERCKIDVRIESELGPESFRVLNNSIVGGDDRGLLYGLGSYLLRCNFHRSEYIIPPLVDVNISVVTPARSNAMRAVYFATHFNIASSCTDG